MALERGFIVDDRYRIEAPIARGSSSIIYRAFDIEAVRPVALKVLSRRGRLTRTLDLFKREVLLLSQLADPRIVSVFDFGTLPDEGPFIVMELVPGVSLDILVSEIGPLEVAHAAAIVGEACLAVESAHAAGVIHRDIKPQNVMVLSPASATPPVKVLDFGISAFAESDLDAGTFAPASPGILGSPNYMAPEQVRGERATRLTDVYALGAVLYHTLTGRPPITGRSPDDIFAAILDFVPPAPSRFRSTLPPALDRIVLRALAKAPSDRFAAPAELAEAVVRAA